MGEDYRGRGSSTAMVWSGWIMSALPVALLVFSASLKLTQNTQAVEGFRALGFPDGVGFTIGLVELICTILYVVPQTAVFGAILLTGYLGGATVTHVRVEEAFVMPVLVGILLWGGLFLRDSRVRALIPLRRKESEL